jgi:hypothetical protein
MSSKKYPEKKQWQNSGMEAFMTHGLEMRKWLFQARTSILLHMLGLDVLLKIFSSEREGGGAAQK